MPSKIKDYMPEKDKPISELYRLAALDYADAYSAWYLMSEMKATQLAGLKQYEMDMDPTLTAAKAEHKARNRLDWIEYIKTMAENNRNRLKAAALMKSIDMRHTENAQANAAARNERKMY